jgi:hypothetical protein
LGLGREKPGMIGRIIEYASYVVIFGGVAFFWIATPSGMN